MAFTIPNETGAFHADLAEPDSRDFADILAPAWNLTGVVSGCEVTAQGTPDMTVAVASGVAIVAGTSATVASGNVTITAADGTNPRFDLICVDSAGTKSAVAGTAASNPVFGDPAGKVVLAAVYVPANDTAIASNQIVDKRVIVKTWVQLAGDTMTGALTILATGATFLQNADGASVTNRISAWGDTSDIVPLPALLLRRFRGTIAAPLRTKADDLMGRVGGTGGHAADDVSAATLLTAARSYIEFRASESFTSTAQGADIRFFTTPAGSTTGAERMRLVAGGELQLDEIQGFASTQKTKLFTQLASTNRTATITGPRGSLTSKIVRYGGGLTGDSDIALYGLAVDHASAGQVTITGAASNGGPNLIRITAASHPFSTGDRVAIGNVGGTTEANAAWTITKIDANTFDLQGSTFTNTYTSGGAATSAGVIRGMFAYVAPTVTRVLGSATGSASNGDDVNGSGAYNGGTAKGTGGYALQRNSANFPSSSEWIVGFGIEANCDFGFRIGDNATIATVGLDIAGTITSGDAIKLGAGHNIKLDTATGTKIATATGQKLAFHNATPVIQRVGAAQAAAATTAATNVAPFGYTTAAQADAIVTLVNEIRAALVEKGLIKGAA
jgi:hypothetical protein